MKKNDNDNGNQKVMSRLVRRMLRKAVSLSLQFCPFKKHWLVRLRKDGSVYRASYFGSSWYIPYAEARFFFWATQFMDREHRFKEKIREGDVVVDVGACTGEYTLYAAGKVGPTGRVYAFEPDPVFFECLAKNVLASGLTNVVVEHAAVSSKDSDDTELYNIPCSMGGGTVEMRERACPSTAYVSRGVVPTITLDSYFSNISGEIDILEVTVNGHEPDVLRGARSLLKRTHTIIWQSQRDTEVRDLLGSNGFLAVELVDLSESPGNFGTAGLMVKSDQ